MKGVRGSDRNNNTLNIKHIFWVVLLTKLFVLMANSASQLFLTEEKIRFIHSLKQFWESVIIAKSDKKAL